MFNIITQFIDTNQRELKRLQKIVEKINSFENEAKKLKQEDFKLKTEEFQKRLKDEKLDDILPEAYAVVREAAYRVLGQRAYDVQLIAATALFEGKIAEQKTGEGKTLSAAFPLYLRALAGKGAHLVTVNDYLARIGAGWNAPVYHLLGLSTGVIAQEQKSYVYDPEYSDTSLGDERLEHLRLSTRKESYAADITYGTNNEYGFDYLRDNMVSSLDNMVQREHYYAIVDEVDSILIDEARTPLIISAPDMDATDKYYQFAEIISKLNTDTDFTIDEKSKSASLTEHGISRVEKILGLTNLYEQDYEAIHHIENALRAKSLYRRDKEYVVRDNEVVIVDEFTGRLMPGRRWSDGLHQAVEAKEAVAIQQESKTLATISFQNYFRMYKVLSGMTGTAATEADEFKKIYNLDTVVVPTHRPVVRQDKGDLIYKTIRAKYGAVVADVEEKVRNGQPVLVGTTSIDKNEIISQYLKRKKIKHNVLNAKNHLKEAQFIAEAGKPGAVTVATNMAGRGVDIVLGGSMPEKEPGMTQDDYKKTPAYLEWKKQHELVLKNGGLHVIGTERHESRRIDNQLRGRSGRQGDPGSTRFYLSLEDDLMRIFGGEQMTNLMNRLKLPDDQPLENVLISKAVEQAQVKVEGFHFDARKRVVEYDDVANQQRDIIYTLRKRILSSDNISEEVLDKLKHQIDRLIILSTATGDKIDIERLVIGFNEIVPLDDLSRQKLKDQVKKINDEEKIKDLFVGMITSLHAQREKELGRETMRQIEKYAYLGSIDHLWMDHIDHIDGLRESVTLRAYGQRNPLVEFKNEAYTLFENLIVRISEELSRRLFRIQVAVPQREIPIEQAKTNEDTTDDTGLKGDAAVAAKKGRQAFSGKEKLGRNDPCWCGSGKKFKKCHYPQQKQ